MTVTILVTILTIGFLGVLLLLLPRMASPAVPFGVRVPDEHVDAPAVREATRQYIRGVTVAVLVVLALVVALIPVLPETVLITAAPFAALVAWAAPYVSARRTVQEAKRSEGWYEGVRQTVAADTSLRTSPPRYPWVWAVPAGVLLLVTTAVGVAVYPTLPDRIATHIGPDGPDRFADTTVWSAFGIVGVQALLTVLVLGLVAVGLRSRQDIVATAPASSADQYRRFLGAMARSVLALAAALNLTMLLVALMIWDVVPPSAGWQVASMAPALAATAVLVVVAVRTGQSGHRLRTAVPDGPTRPGTAHRDDDAHWIGGLIYINRDDPALFVPKRFGGVGWTVNLGRPVAWVFVGAILALTVGSLVWGLIQDGDETGSSGSAPAASAPASTDEAGGTVRGADLSAIEGTPVAEALTWTLDALAADEPPTDAEIEAAFHESALAELPAEQLRAAFVQLAGDYRLTALTAAGSTALSGEIADTTGQRWRLQLAVADGAEESQITTLFFQPPLADPPAFASWDEAGESLRRLAGQVTFLAAEVDGATCRPLASHDPDVRGPLGSVFKLYVLGALADAVEAGEVAWDDDIVVDEALLSLPSGVLQAAEPGTSVPVAEAARLMISISDNTATDHLIALLGRETVEQAQVAYGHGAPDVNRPLLTTRELFQLKWQVDDTARAGYLDASEAGRRAFLDELADGPLEVDVAGAISPVAPDDLEWFASADELCSALALLDQTAAEPGFEPVAEALGINPLVRLDDTGRWTRFAAKGGSEPGVLAYAFLLERADDGRVFAFTATMLDGEQVDQDAAVPVVEGALALLAEE